MNLRYKYIINEINAMVQQPIECIIDSNVPDALVKLFGAVKYECNRMDVSDIIPLGYLCGFLNENFNMQLSAYDQRIISLIAENGDYTQTDAPIHWTALCGMIGKLGDTLNSDIILDWIYEAELRKVSGKAHCFSRGMKANHVIS